MKIKSVKVVFFLLLCSFPGFLFLNSWQVYRYDQLMKQTSQLEEEQIQWYELNKRLATKITQMRGPEKLEEKAMEHNLQDVSLGQHIHIRITGSGRADNE